VSALFLLQFIPKDESDMLAFGFMLMGVIFSFAFFVPILIMFIEFLIKSRRVYHRDRVEFVLRLSSFVSTFGLLVGLIAPIASAKILAVSYAVLCGLMLISLIVVSVITGIYDRRNGEMSILSRYRYYRYRWWWWI